LQDFTPLTDVGEKTKILILQDIKKRFGSIEHVNILAICTILDPRFKKIYFNDKIACSQIISEITDMLHGNVTKDITHTNSNIIEENESLWSFHKKLMDQNQLDQQIICNEEKGMELRNYLRKPVTDLKTDVIKFWCDQKITYCTNLWKIALRHVVIMSISVSCERLFSNTGNIITDKRNRLTGERFDKLLFLKSLHFDELILMEFIYKCL